jgi:hypothetical protein
MAAYAIARDAVKDKNRSKLASIRSGIMNLIAIKLKLQKKWRCFYASFNPFRAMSLKNNIFCDISLCRLLHIYHILLSIS